MTRSMLHRLEDLCNVDVDDADTELIKSIPFTPHNQTSNQAIITNALLADEPLLKDLVRQYGSQGWERAVHLTARNIPYLSGRVLIQTSLRHVSSSADTLAHARRLAALYEEAGVPRDRFAIKIPFSGPAAAAAAVLNQEGIRTLATSVFSLEQGIAASQSGCLFISPYYNEIAAHLDPSLRLTLEDPALEHPMSPRVIHILEAFAKAYRETGKEQPIMVIASHFTPAEIMAMAELGCPHVTIPPHLIRTLLDTPDTLPLPTTKKPAKLNYGEFATVQRLTKLSTIDPFARPDWDGKLADMQTDYIANDGEKLDEALKNDPIAGKRLKDAEVFFIEMENKAKEAIEKEIAAQGL
ncbi:aldolase [Trichoderma reesei RUT C-30]|uniref:Aldolase n=1 Tax=Hypocrea jecorina (strain ATCC 56765 / BCRC 32924 / NRRL 11460 / Rut C-30) TaxID=1344414 RepID=A0A024S3Z4_HYPJR|nr:aldolase [Trichoderma reesei RUT C-30]